MRVPLDIINAILDAFALPSDEAGITSVVRDPHDEETLRACALTSRSFLSRSQLHLFSAITCRSHSHLVKLDQLLATSPHIGALYMGYFALRIAGIPTVEFDADSSAPFPQVFLPRLLLARFPVLLRHTKGVKRLSLFRLEFLDTSSGRDSRHIQADDGPTVLLEHLYLTRTTKYVVDAMRSGLSAVDIKHLRSLTINQRSMPLPLLKANAPTLQKIRYIVPDSQANPDPLDPDILAGSESLHAIEIVQHPHHMAYTLGELGNLRHLKAPPT
ncbi:hypothetical protein C8J57DRAFT_1710521 [Mycena rebaudengoi]|nr:hypothetical protein C8J57DRAFT_1710521 [Mycena rebaudengoi]